MKNKYNLTKSIGKKNIVLAVVALVLVMMTAVGASFSWIEEVSQVEFNSNNGQETPLHVGSKVLKSDAVMKESPASKTIDLNEYFYKSGDMHLSPCYSDGVNFYFPVTKTSGSDKFRTGTKDDANVNYLSATFRVKSDSANTAYWFEKTDSKDFITFKNSSNAAVSDLQKYLRISVTVDGNTNVYAYNDTGKFNALSSSTATKATEQTGRRVDKYMYYTEAFNNSAPLKYYKNTANITNKPNQGSATSDFTKNGNLNGNTLFTVNKYDSSKKSGIKEVTVKLWLEYNSEDSVKDVKVSDINLNLVSSWNKTRRIYVRDVTILQEGYSQAKWLSHNGTSDNQAGLYWALTDDTSKNWELTRVKTSSGDDTEYYYVDIPAVYNNVDATLFRKQKKGDFSSTTWDSWKTTFPNTFHSETYSVYTKDFATWNEDDVNSVYFVNSAFFTNVYDYMWDSNSVINTTDINAKVVMNAKWPGIKMNTKMQKKTTSQSLDAYAFYYNSDYDRIIFNDGDLVTGANQEYQTQDLWLTDSSGKKLGLVDGTFDMTTLTWFHTNPTKSDWSTKMPSYSGSTTYIYGNFSTNNAWKKTRFAYGGEYKNTSGNAFNGSSNTHMLCKIYCKSGGDYQFKLCWNGDWYGAYKNGDKRVTPNSNYYIDGTFIPNEYGLASDSDHQENFIMKGINGGDIIRIYLDTNDKKLYFAKGEN